MDFNLSPEIEDIRVRTRAFIAAEVMPLEADRGNFDEHDNIRIDLLPGLYAKAKTAGRSPDANGSSPAPRWRSTSS